MRCFEERRKERITTTDATAGRGPIQNLLRISLPNFLRGGDGDRRSFVTKREKRIRYAISPGRGMANGSTGGWTCAFKTPVERAKDANTFFVQEK